MLVENLRWKEFLSSRLGQPRHPTPQLPCGLEHPVTSTRLSKGLPCSTTLINLIAPNPNLNTRGQPSVRHRGLICYRLAAGSTFVSAESQWTDTQISLQGCKQTKKK